MSDSQSMVDAKLNAIALTHAALAHDQAGLYALIGAMDLDECRDAIGNLISLSAALLEQLSDDPLSALEEWARATVAEGAR